MDVGFRGLGETVATFINCEAENAIAGELVKISGNGEISPCVEGDAFCGVCLSSGDGFAAVQIAGFVSVPYTGAAPAPGYAKLAAESNRAVKTDAVNGREYLVIECDTSAETVGFVL